MSQITTAEALAMMAECFMETPENLRSDMPRSALPGWDSKSFIVDPIEAAPALPKKAERT